jgi:hypothetical protein
LQRLGERPRRSPNQRAEEDDPAPSSRDRKEDDYLEKLRKSLDPSSLETYSGKPMNTLLGELQDRRAARAPVPKVPLEKDVLKSINVISDKDTGSIGLLKNQGKLSWPPALRAPEFATQRESLDSLVPQTILQAIQGGVDADRLKELRETVNKMEDQLAKDKKAPASAIAQLTPGDYIKTQRYLTQLKEALGVLGQPDAGNYFNGKYAPRGETVADLVEHMTKEGLRFAPAEAGDETSYKNLHRALAVAVVAAQNSQRTGD